MEVVPRYITPLGMAPAGLGPPPPTPRLRWEKSAEEIMLSIGLCGITWRDHMEGSHGGIMGGGGDRTEVRIAEGQLK